MAWLRLSAAALILLAAFVFAPKGWRTVLVNAVTGGLVIVADLVTSVQDILPEGWSIYGIVAVNVINVLLRRVTTTPLGRSS